MDDEEKPLQGVSSLRAWVLLQQLPEPGTELLQVLILELPEQGRHCQQPGTKRPRRGTQTRHPELGRKDGWPQGKPPLSKEKPGVTGR